MALSPTEVFASKLQQLAATAAPLIKRIDPQEYTSDRIYYYCRVWVTGQPTPYQPEESASPLTAYRRAASLVSELKTLNASDHANS